MRSGVFICPVCGRPLEASDKTLSCENKHAYDVARTGYVYLLKPNEKNSVDPGDNKEMIAARVRVMGKGYYAALAQAAAEEIAPEDPSLILDAGCGTGYTISELKKAFKDTECVGTDISKYAIDKAAKLYKDVDFAVASSKRLPLADESVDALFCAFAPVYEAEFLRVLKKSGLFLRVVPAENHLYKLKEFLYDTPRKNEEDERVFEAFALVKTRFVEGEFTGDKEDVKALVKMTPYYYHTSEEILKKLESVEKLTVNTSFEMRVYIK